MKSFGLLNVYVYVLFSSPIMHFVSITEGNIASKDFFIEELFGKNKTFMPYSEFFALYDIFLKYEDTAGDMDYHHDTTPCLSSKNLIYDIFNYSSKALDSEAFKELCPAIVMQADFGYCSDDDLGRDTFTNYTDPDNGTGNTTRDEQSWYLSFGAITLVNGVSIIILLHLPQKDSKLYPYIHSFLLMFGIAALLSDTFLQLLPYAVGIQNQHTGSRLEESGDITSSTGGGSSFGVDSYVWKSLSVLIGLYVITMAEIVLVIGQKGNFGLSGIGHLRRKADSEEVVSGTGLKGQVSKTLIRDTSKPSIDESRSRRGTVKSTSNASSINENSGTNPELGNAVDKHSSKYDTQITNAHGWSFKGVVWMVAASESFHNFINGCVLGLVFTHSYGFGGGVSTTITILLSEVPHEVSDYLILVTYGLPIQNAVFINFICSIFAYAGVAVGVILGSNWIGFMPWAFALASGLFIYISLASMLPEVKETPLLEKRPIFCLITFSLAYVAGVALMFFLAGFEGSVARVLTTDKLRVRDMSGVTIANHH